MTRKLFVSLSLLGMALVVAVVASPSLLKRAHAENMSGDKAILKTLESLNAQKTAKGEARMEALSLQYRGL